MASSGACRLQLPSARVPTRCARSVGICVNGPKSPAFTKKTKTYFAVCEICANEVCMSERLLGVKAALDTYEGLGETPLLHAVHTGAQT